MAKPNLRTRTPLLGLLGTALFLAAASAQGADVKLVPLDPAFGDPVQLEPGESMLLLVEVEGLPSDGLAAFQIELDFDPEVVMLADPNVAGVNAFAPLGDSPAVCAAVRETPTCDDPPWLLTSTGRSPLGTSEIDEVAGTLLVAYGTSGTQSLPNSDGALAIIEVVARSAGSTEVFFNEALLADDSEPPTEHPVSTWSLIFEVPEPTGERLALAACGALAALARRRPRVALPPARPARRAGAGPPPAPAPWW